MFEIQLPSCFTLTYFLISTFVSLRKWVRKDHCSREELTYISPSEKVHHSYVLQYSFFVFCTSWHFRQCNSTSKLCHDAYNALNLHCGFDCMVSFCWGYPAFESGYASRYLIIINVQNKKKTYPEKTEKDTQRQAVWGDFER